MPKSAHTEWEPSAGKVKHQQQHTLFTILRVRLSSSVQIVGIIRCHLERQRDWTEWFGKDVVSVRCQRVSYKRTLREGNDFYDCNSVTLFKLWGISMLSIDLERPGDNVPRMVRRRLVQWEEIRREGNDFYAELWFSSSACSNCEEFQCHLERPRDQWADY